jgi:sialic acid synthase SpsE
MIDGENMKTGGFKLGSKENIGLGNPYVIAEIGVNHEGSMELARKLIDLAKEGGADAAKFQSYKADTIASRHSPAYWDTSKEATLSQHQLFQKYDSFTPEDYERLAEHCKACEIDFLSTPFDHAAVDFLDPLMPFFKIASADITNIPLIRKVAGKNKPVVLSTGASTLAEIDLATQTLNHCGIDMIVLLHCILNYPTEDPNAHLLMIRGLKRAFPELPVGYSDHTLPKNSMLALITSHLLGAMVIEKHFTHDKTLPGNDHYHAMDKSDLREFIRALENISVLVGDSDFKHYIPTEEISRQNARRSVVLSQSLKVGETLTEELLICKRPGYGISPLFWDNVVGTRVAMDLDVDTILQWHHLEKDA